MRDLIVLLTCVGGVAFVLGMDIGLAINKDTCEVGAQRQPTTIIKPSRRTQA